MNSDLEMPANSSTSARSISLPMARAAWKPRGRVHPPKLRDDGIAKRFALVSSANETTQVSEMDRKLLQVQANFATLFHASPAILCIIQLEVLRYREINQVYERRT